MHNIRSFRVQTPFLGDIAISPIPHAHFSVMSSVVCRLSHRALCLNRLTADSAAIWRVQGKEI